MPEIVLRGVRTRNLRGFDVSFPPGSWTHVLGVSGSGKTSLCFHTLHALSQQGFLSAMAPAARLLLEDLPRPSLDSSRGLMPTLALEQGDDRPSARTRALELAGLELALRSLFVACGTAHSPVSGQALRAWQAAQVADHIVQTHPSERLQVLFPAGGKGREHWELRGFTRGLAGGFPVELGEALPDGAGLDWIVADRLVAEGRHRLRIGEAVRLAFASAQGRAAIQVLPREGSPILLEFPDHPHCPDGGGDVPRASMGAFSPNTGAGACRACSGTGADGAQPCAACHGSGLGAVAQWYRLGGLTMPQLLESTFEEMAGWLERSGLPGDPREAVSQTASDLRGRLECLRRLGLGYLQAGRRAPTLSYGELHRLRLVQLTGAPLSGVCYVLDEPSTGLHPQDALRLRDHLRGLVELGNTLVVVDHRLRDLHGDRVIEIGPGSGQHGGELVFEGTLAEHAEGATPGAVWRQRTIAPSSFVPEDFLRLDGACGRNLRAARLEVALGGITGVCGPSGAGKSTLVLETLVPALRARLGAAVPGLPFGSLGGGESLEAVEVVDPSDESVVNVRSMVATLAGVLDPLRSLMAALPAAKAQGFAASRFSPNLKGGRCETCQGTGRLRVDLPYLPVSWSECPQCGGLRFSPEVLEIRWRGLNLGQILSMSCEEALERFLAHPPLRAVLEPLVTAGLGYLPLGFPASGLSGGELARLRLCAPLARKVRPTLFVLEEPSRGLHPADTQVLFELLRSLVRQGHAVLAVSHDPGFLARCDWLCELGPGAAQEGGRTMACGTPLAVAAGTTATADALRRELGEPPG